MAKVARTSMAIASSALVAVSLVLPFSSPAASASAGSVRASAVPAAPSCDDGIGIAAGATVLEGGPTGPAAPTQTARVGDAVDYVVSVNLRSTDCPVTGDSVSLTLPNGTNQTLASNVSLSPGQSKSFDEKALGHPLYTFSSADLTKGVATALAATNGVAHDNNGFLEPASASTTFGITVIRPETTLTKTASTTGGPVPLAVTYTFKEANVSPDTFAGSSALDAISNVAVTDSDPNCTPAPVLSGGFNVGDTNHNGVLDPGETWTYTCTETFTTVGSFTDTASATGTAGDGRQAGTPASQGAPSAEQSGPVTVSTTTPIISVTKVDTSPGDGVPVTAGQSAPIVYDLLVSNTGGAAATNVTVTDGIPAGSTYVPGSATCNGLAGCTASEAGGVVTWTLASVPAGGSADLGFQVTVDAGDANGFVISNTASFTNVNTPGCTSPTCQTNTVTNPVVSAPGLSIVKSAVPPSGSTVTPGQQIVYTLTASNSGGSAATGVVISDVVPTGTMFVSATAGGTESGGVVTWPAMTIPAGGQVAVSFTVTVDSTDPNGTVITNVGELTGPGCAPCSSNQTQHTVITPILSVSKVDTSPGNGVSVTAGQSAPIVYDLLVSNTGGAAATNVTVTDGIPAGSTYVPGSATCNGLAGCTASEAGGVVTWTLASVPAGGSADLGFQVTVNATDANGFIIANTATYTNENTPGCTTPTCSTNTVTNPVVAPVHTGILCNNAPTTCTIGFWKNHPAATSSLLPLTLGSYAVTTFSQARAILSDAACRSPIDCMAAQFLGTLLNVANGMPSSCIAADIASAQALLNAVDYAGPGNHLAPTASQVQEALTLHNAFDAYNSDHAAPC